MQIAHEEARRLIQFNVDKVLDSDKDASLSAHLKDCVECRAYAREIEEVDRILSPLLKRQWTAPPLPLPISRLLRNKASKRWTQPYLIMRITVLGVVLLGFAFSAWQFVFSGTRMSQRIPPGILPVPTPSIQLTSTESRWTKCSTVSHTVRQGETLEGIARRFSASMEDVIAFNNLTDRRLTTGMELGIPLCHLTPTGTAADPATLTMTFAPVVNPTTSTPDG
ncbi:MAG TPA: LysM peptidoglycan-binding domain-containing protein [Anaerolineales bacterium]|nr:LysM peptidoglycan-binding domain-containing protein [Anaerolineales bacterium]